jgi:NADPH:quinone reductase-like Zn-dependent oxidoreductase
MRAIVLTDYGDVDKLEIRDVAEPTPGPGEVKVRVFGSSINPIDWKIRTGKLRAVQPLSFPAVPGRDASGEVVEVGRGVTALRAGDRVTGLVWGAYAEYVVASEAAWAVVPAGMDLVDAAALPLVVLTGAQLVEQVRAQADDVVLVTGAVGGVGRAAVFTARARGARVWAGVREAQTEEARSLGAQGVVALDNDSDLDHLPPLHAIADTVGGPTVEKLLSRLEPKGVLGSVVGAPAGAVSHDIVVRTVWAQPAPTQLAELVAAVANGELKIPIAARFPLERIREAQSLAQKGAGGKVVLRVG